MYIFDPLDELLYNLEYGLDDLVGTIAGIGIVAGVLYVLFMLVTIVGLYVMPRYALVLRGKKAGVDKTWMAYVPFVSVYYKMQITKEPWWKMLFFDGFNIIVVAIMLSFMSVVGESWFSWLTAITLLGYFCASFILSINYYAKVFRGFGFNAGLGFFYVVPAVSVVPRIVEFFISFDNRIKFDRNGEKVINSGLLDRAVADRGAAPVQTGKIRGLAGKYMNAVIDINVGDVISFGRNAQMCNIVFDPSDDAIGRNHCSVRLSQNGSYIVTDNNSVNGTFYDDGRRFPAAVPVTVSKGTIICIGSKKDRFILD